MDALIERLELEKGTLAAGQQIAAFDALMPAVEAEIERSYGLIDQVYELEAKLGDTTSPAVGEFGEERARAAVRFTASLYLTAWEKSAELRLPGWLQR